MGVEGGTISAGGIGAGAVGAGAGIGGGLGIGPSFSSFVSEGSAGGFGSLASLGPKLEAPSLSFVNEGPVKGGLEMFKPIGQINFNNQSELNAADVVLEAQSILAQVRPQPAGTEVPAVFQAGLADMILDPAIKPPVPKLDIFERPAIPPIPEIKSVIEPVERIPFPAIQPAVMPDIGIFSEPEIKTENTLFAQPATQPPILTPLVEKQTIEGLVEEKVAVAAKEDAQIQSKEEDVSEEVKLQRVVDQSAARQRIEEIIESATKVAQIDGEGEIDGRKIVEQLPGQHPKNRSGELNIIDPAGKLLDGTLLATFKQLAREKFASVLDVIKRASKIVLKNIPVTRGEGQAVTDEDVAKVYQQYKGRIPPAQEVIKRVSR